MKLEGHRSPQVSRTRLNILVDLKNGVIWNVSIRLLISNFSNPLFFAFETIPSTEATISITIILMSYNFFSSRARSKYCHSFRFL